jgi:transposase InsO family protein
MHRFNHERLHGTVGDIPPAEFEAIHYAQLVTAS